MFFSSFFYTFCFVFVTSLVHSAAMSPQQSLPSLFSEHSSAKQTVIELWYLLFLFFALFSLTMLHWFLAFCGQFAFDRSAPAPIISKHQSPKRRAASAAPLFAHPYRSWTLVGFYFPFPMTHRQNLHPAQPYTGHTTALATGATGDDREGQSENKLQLIKCAARARHRRYSAIVAHT